MQPHATDLFLHIRVVMGIVLGMGMTRLLTGLARFVQHPGTQKIYPVHLGWAASMLLTLIHFWWWEFALRQIEYWSFLIYFFLIGYTILLYLLCTLLFPDNLAEYSGYEDFFLSRRKWFFSILALTFVCDFIDTLLKGQAHVALFGSEYLVRLPAYLVLCAVAIWTANRRFHVAFVAASLIYQLSWIFRLFNTVT
ncbi:hypothetical protein [Labrys wisconsinensis]|uniref:Mll4938 protein n=1 Tax=Labrys wisconsinensis TaxID=425677 RepID=A0ABU0JBA9_9HYPH|nr:hypothetical protein [Labrys wisconsinensis]MDQ0471562.1 hypothetical protein [Labrys wisconsinensis]